jgi:hypothetical protein
MSDHRLPTDLWVSAGLKRCSVEHVPAVLRHRGDAKGGMVVLKLTRNHSGDTHAADCQVLSQMRDMNGKLGFSAVHDADFIPDADAETYIARAVERDPDLWVVEVESGDGWHPFDDA